jgi:hypothetical protein
MSKTAALSLAKASAASYRVVIDTKGLEAAG